VTTVFFLWCETICVFCSIEMVGCGRGWWHSFYSFFRSSCISIDPAGLAHRVPVIAFRSFWRGRV
jgi:hypothetical protein